MYDNVLNYFQASQIHFSSKDVILVSEVLIFVLTLGWVLLMTAHWFYRGTTFEFPMAVLIFYLIKLVSDVSMVLERPHNTLWIDINISLYTFRYEEWFLSNVDPYVGIHLIALIYFITHRKLIRQGNGSPREHCNLCKLDRHYVH